MSITEKVTFDDVAAELAVAHEKLAVAGRLEANGSHELARPWRQAGEMHAELAGELAAAFLAGSSC